MSNDNAALDCLFGPYDFLDTAQQPSSPMQTMQRSELEQQQEQQFHEMTSSTTRLVAPRPVYNEHYLHQGQTGHASAQNTPQSSQLLVGQHLHPQPLQAPRGPTLLQSQPLAPPSLPLNYGTQQQQATGYRRSMPVQPQDEPGPKRVRQPQQNTNELLTSAPESDDQLQDKADRCRARNREHARQTRRRKKEFVENLQSSVQQLGREKEALQKRVEVMERNTMERSQRFESVAKIMSLRVSGSEKNSEKLNTELAELVDPDFELRLPRTPYRSFPAFEVTADGGRLVSGIPAAIADLKSLRVCLTSFLRRLKQRRAGCLGMKAASSMAWGGGGGVSESSSSHTNTGKQQNSSVSVIRTSRHKLVASTSTPSFDDPSTAQTSSDDAERSELSLRPNSSSDDDSPPESSVSGSPDQQVNTRRLADPRGGTTKKNSQEAVMECFLEREAIAWTEDGTMLAPWVLRLTDDKGNVVLRHRGTLRATFRTTSTRDIDEKSTHRIASLEIIHDTLAMWQQLQRGVRPDKTKYRPVPNTLDAALEPSEEARVVTTATRPFVIEHVNGAWTKLCGYEPEESIGKTLKILQGPDTEIDQVQSMVEEAERGHTTTALLTNYNKEGQKFKNFLRVYPLAEDDDDSSSKPSHMLGILQHDISL